MGGVGPVVHCGTGLPNEGGAVERGQEPSEGRGRWTQVGHSFAGRPPGTGRPACRVALALNRFKIPSELPVCSVQFSRLVVSDCLRPRGLQHASILPKCKLSKTLGTSPFPEWFLSFPSQMLAVTILLTCPQILKSGH